MCSLEPAQQVSTSSRTHVARPLTCALRRHVPARQAPWTGTMSGEVCPDMHALRSSKLHVVCPMRVFVGAVLRSACATRCAIFSSICSFRFRSGRVRSVAKTLLRRHGPSLHPPSPRRGLWWYYLLPPTSPPRVCHAYTHLSIRSSISSSLLLVLALLLGASMRTATSRRPRARRRRRRRDGFALCW